MSLIIQQFPQFLRNYCYFYNEILLCFILIIATPIIENNKTISCQLYFRGCSKYIKYFNLFNSHNKNTVYYHKPYFTDKETEVIKIFPEVIC